MQGLEFRVQGFRILGFTALGIRCGTQRAGAYFWGY